MKNFRIDHLAFRVEDRLKTAEFFIKSFDYKVQTEFNIKFEDGSETKCIALEPPQKITSEISFMLNDPLTDKESLYHLPPEIFISDGEEDSIVGKWVKERKGTCMLHHIAYQVDSVKYTMNEWKEKGYAEFASEDILECDDLVQVFTKPNIYTGLVYEFIQRKDRGFCSENVKKLMISTQDFK